MSKKFFGTDGIRGRVGEEPITPQTVLKLGWAAGRVLGGLSKNRGRVIIGKDTRVSGYLLESALEAGFSAAGVDISLLGPMPTPGIAYLTRTARACAGVVISASHNPYHDNGIKFFSPEGCKLSNEIERAIEAEMEKPMLVVESGALGKAGRFPDAAGRYIEYCKSTVPHRLSLAGLTIVLDCANGAAYHIAPEVLTELGAKVITVAAEPDGFNINDQCGSTSPELLVQTVAEQSADLGIALDGDGDRVIMVDSRGEIVDGDQILYIMSIARQVSNRLGGGVIGTVMSNLGLEQALDGHGISFKRASVGDRYVLALLQSEGWTLGGESSGHIICLDKSSTGDGIIAALEVLTVMVESGKPLSELKSGMQVFPQRMINVPVSTNSRANGGFDVNNNAAVREAVRFAEGELAAHGRVLLRSSGTEPVVRVMVEGTDERQVERISHSLAEVVKGAASTAP
ncbi:MAG TPA: phosphoglucosamine mutase [Acidiferrobacteraceae bacterium]|nr:phosphoglucosamine mutase [Acidiferrobacteraceae bacterium]